VPMAMGSAIKLRRIVHNVKHVIAIELLCALQALEFRRPLRSSPAIEEAYVRARKHVAPLDRDRVLGSELFALTSAVAEASFSDLAPWPTT